MFDQPFKGIQLQELFMEDKNVPRIASVRASVVYYHFKPNWTILMVGQ